MLLHTSQPKAPLKTIIGTMGLILIIISSTYGQNIAINNTGNPPDASAMLDVSSQTKGFLLPRMTALERISIPFPQTGLLVFDLDLQSLFIFDGGYWVEFASTRKGLRDSDFDTNILVEQSTDDDTIRFFSGGIEKLKLFKDGLFYESDSSNLYLGSGLQEKGASNIVLGHNSGSQFDEESKHNVLIGNNSANEINITDHRNIMIGDSIAPDLNQSRRNIFIGHKSFNSPAGLSNVSIGTNSGYIHPVGGSSNVFLGDQAFKAGRGSNNVSIGAHSGHSDIYAAENNVFIGEHAGKAISGALFNNITIGTYSGHLDDGGVENILIGRRSGELEKGGNKNVYIGDSSGYTSIIPVHYNVSLGANSGRMVGGGSDNIFIGKNAGSSGTSYMSGNILVGPNIGHPSSTLNDKLMIDNEVTSSPLIWGDLETDELGFNGHVGIFTNEPSSEMHILHENNSDIAGLTLENENNGNYWRFYVRSANGNLRLYSTDGEGNSCGNNGGSDDYVAWVSSCSGAWNSTSDRRKKKSLTPLHSVLPTLMNLEVLKYNFLSEYDTDKKHIGLIAQDVENYFPELVNYDEEADLYTMNYDGFGPIAIKAVQELKAENETLKMRLEKLESLVIKLLYKDRLSLD